MDPLAADLRRYLEDGLVWDSADMWATTDQTREELVELYRTACRTAWRHADESIEQLPLDAPASVSWWPKERRATTFGSLLVRVVAETAHHAGHADIVRELIDGRSGADHEKVGDTEWWTRYVARVQEAADHHRQG